MGGQRSPGGHVSLYGPFSTASLSSVSLRVANKLSVPGLFSELPCERSRAGGLARNPTAPVDVRSCTTASNLKTRIIVVSH